ncbi:hypothetical protein ACLOJK_011094 [Asimina triloba]
MACDTFFDKSQKPKHSKYINFLSINHWISKVESVTLKISATISKIVRFHDNSVVGGAVLIQQRKYWIKLAAVATGHFLICENDSSRTWRIDRHVHEDR